MSDMIHNEMIASGKFICDFLASFEKNIGRYVYLRNHEELPLNVGNDVDLLLERGKRQQAIEFLRKFSGNSGWRILRQVEFGPLSAFLVSDDNSEFLHIDFFDRLDWHWAPYANTKRIIDNRQWNGHVYHPSPGDEVYINVMTRLLYEGRIREKHRKQADLIHASSPKHLLNAAFESNAGSPHVISVSSMVTNRQWEELEGSTRKIRLMVLLNSLRSRSFDSMNGLIRYANRGVNRLMKPPGLFVVFEGADGVGKSTVIDRILPALEGLSGRKDTLMFHWKPCRVSMRSPGEPPGPQMDPRSSVPRSIPLSFLFLAYHWLGFWWGWLRYLRPALVKNRAVIGDRYAHEFFLDPARLRLNLPPWLLRFAARCAPQPDLVIALIADPSRIATRKQELAVEEIEVYQKRVLHLQKEMKSIVVVDADQQVDEVANRVIEQLISISSSYH
jgi:thymidylate kinase